METVELRISERSSVGSSNARRERRDGMLPAVVYQPGSTSVPFLLSKKDFSMAARGKAPTQVFKLLSEDTLNNTLTLVKSVQIEPRKGDLLHVEFLALKEGQKVIVDVPVVLSGIPECVRLNTAIVNQTSYKVSLLCATNFIPAELTLDISDMKAGESLTAGDITLPEGTVLKSRSGMTIVSALIDRRAVAQAEAQDAQKS